MKVEKSKQEVPSSEVIVKTNTVDKKVLLDTGSDINLISRKIVEKKR